MRRIFVTPEQLRAGSITLGPDEAHYVARVLRLEPGAAIELFDGAGRRAAATVTAVGRGDVHCDCGAPVSDLLSAIRAVRCGLPLLKGERLDLAVRMLTELGVAEIVLLVCARSVPRDAPGSERVERLRRVARAAARQCGRPQLPRIDGPLTLVAFAASASGSKWYGESVGNQARECAQWPDPGERAVTLCTGPEGGFTAAETVQLQAAGFAPLRLGPHVLRAETAAVVAAALALAG
ncbi:MAG: 16S rRNA (uracil(1498)-N(3))-methyltransferase [Deltaproteobacteria bacterium]|nr:16S rRNA (uracil(1498)-N(3))-methyltransferase [Deltaproteobacteria bacterium]